MKAESLRIGNWVLTDTGTATQIRGGGINAIESGSLEVSPIPLTEDWLLKFGFERFGNSDRYYLNEFYFENISLCRDETFIANIEHVHSLQNLYFALTNTELEWNGK